MVSYSIDIVLLQAGFSNWAGITNKREDDWTERADLNGLLPGSVKGRRRNEPK